MGASNRGGEGILPHAAEGADPIPGYIFKGSPRLHAAVGIALFRIINITAYITNIFFHIESPLPLVYRLFAAFSTPPSQEFSI
jgi:hypothetical protein